MDEARWMVFRFQCPECSGLIWVDIALRGVSEIVIKREDFDSPVEHSLSRKFCIHAKFLSNPGCLNHMKNWTWKVSFPRKKIWVSDPQGCGAEVKAVSWLGGRVKMMQYVENTFGWAHDHGKEKEGIS